MDVTITLDDADLEAALNRAVAAGTDLRQPMGEIAGEWIMLVHERFEQEKDPLGVPWAKRRDNADPERKLLQLSRMLHNAVIPEFGSDFAEVGVLETGGPAKYARIHNEGGVIVPRVAKALSFGGRLVSKVVMPKRQYVGFGPQENESAVRVLAEFLRGLFAGARA